MREIFSVILAEAGIQAERVLSQTQSALRGGYEMDSRLRENDNKLGDSEFELSALVHNQPLTALVS